jgi:hypothetical protein
MIALLIVLGVIEFRLRTRLDKTDEGDVLLWYGRKKRKYFKF